MIKKFVVFVFALTAINTIGSAQYNTGDSGVNASLLVIDDGAKADYSAFKSEMSTTYNVPETKIKSMTDSGMKGGDIFMVLESSKVTKKPVDEVVKVYQANQKKGWGAIAKELGIKPGSPEFKALKSSADTKAKKVKANQTGKAKPKK